MSQNEHAPVQSPAQPAAEVPVLAPYPPPPPIPVPEFAYPVRRRARPLLGASLWLAGALLWAYVVLGQLVLLLDFPEPLAVLLLLGVGFLNWRHTTSATQRIAPGLIGVALWASTLLLSIIVLGSTDDDVAEFVTLLLLVTGVSSYLLGRRLAPSPSGREFPRPALVAGWVVVVLASAFTLASAIAEL